MPSARRTAPWVLVVFCLAASAPAGAQSRDAKRTALDRHNAQVLLYKERELNGMLGRAQIFHDFVLSDEVEASGIAWRHRIVDDAGKYYKPVHYDHGNGLAVADVDGDGLLDIYFTTQMGSNALYRNKGGGKFEDITEAAGVGVADRISVAPSFGDIDNDGDADLFVTTVRMGNLLFENDGKGVFKDISKQAGVDHVGHSSGAVFLDYNRDGLLDLFVTNVGKYTVEERGRGGYWVGYESDAFSGHLFEDRYEHSILYENKGKNRFQDVTEAVGLIDHSWSGDASAVDFNGDLFPDIYLLNMQGHDEYYVNVDGKRFEKKSRDVFPRTSWGAMGVKSFDYNNDGLMDLYVTDMHSDMSKTVAPPLERKKSDMIWKESFTRSGGNSVWGNSFYKNTGDGTFAEVSDALGVEQYWPWGHSVGDLNSDGFQDIFVAACMNYPFRYAINSLLMNNRGQEFLDMVFKLGVEPRRGRRMMTHWFDLDCSGADKGHKECKGRTGKISVDGTLGTRSSVIFDLDGDGDQDIVTNDFNSEPMILVSNLTEKRPIRYINVRLVGTKSNRDGLGATVRVSAGGSTYTQVHDGASGYLSHSLVPLHFGLDAAEKVDGIEVRWPSGKTQTITEGIALNATTEIVEK